ncbi:hypothetical protein P7C73_g3798, partial [Tremellales sp. Uapishka_1]
MSKQSGSRPVVLITGCSEPGSLGAATSREFLGRGFRVFATARRLSTLNELEGSGCDVLSLDVTDADSIAKAKAEVIRLTGGRLDFLVNNAGVIDSSPLLEVDLDGLRAQYEINLFGPLRMIQAFTPLLANSAIHGGTESVILNVGTAASRLGVPFQGGYDSSKAALQTLSDVLRREMKNLGVHVMTLELALVNTTATSNMDHSALNIRSAEAQQSSAYYPNFPEIVRANREMFRKEVAKAPTVRDTAKYIVDAMTATSPKPKFWLGQNYWLAKYVWELLPISTGDNMMSKMLGADKVVKPGLVDL